MDDATKEDLLAILNEKQEEIQWLKSELDEANHSRELSDADCVTLRKERDEARREVCGLLVACHTDPDDDKPDPNLKHIHAGIRGWDCFKENDND